MFRVLGRVPQEEVDAVRQDIARWDAADAHFCAFQIDVHGEGLAAVFVRFLQAPQPLCQRLGGEVRGVEAECGGHFEEGGKLGV